MINKILSYIITKIKGSNYTIDPQISSWYLLHFIYSRCVMLLRGVLRYQRLCFVGTGTKIVCRNKIVVGKFSTIGEFSHLDGLATNGIILGSNSSVGPYSKIRSTMSLKNLGVGVSIGNNVGIGGWLYLGGWGGISIGDDTIIGERLTVHSDKHLFEDESLLIRHQGVQAEPVVVGKNCWIGSNVTILGGVTIGDRCVIGAGSVVTKSFSPGSLLVGNPARCVRQF